MDGVVATPQLVIIEVECSACEGTGIYRGFREPPGVGIICIYCNGEGKRQISHTPFSGRKIRTDITEVRNRNDSSAEKTMTYQEFLAGIRP